MTDSLFKQYQGSFEEKELEVKKKATGFAYNPFPLQNAVGEKNVKNIWIEYHKLIFQGIVPEDLIFKIIGKVRDMLAISMGASKEDLGIQKDYPYNKSKRDLKNWKIKELQDFYAKLVAIYHQSRMTGGESLGIALEKTLLSV